MKHILFLLALFCIGITRAQDTTRILFIGNSFTYYNAMPSIVKAIADSARLPVVTGMHAPGGVSVGDIAQGNMAHMNNPALFSLIRSKKWDVAVIQDNQGRFVRDSAQFPSSSLVVQGHLNIMDSVKANNSCAKIVLFGGWAWKNGMPPYGNTGIESIRRILVNYRVLNDTMKETISPIGEAWIRAVQHLPVVDLWDTDEAHPSYSGSYLTAAILFSTLFDLPTRTITCNGNLSAAQAYALRAVADTSFFGLEDHARYNLGAISRVVIQNNSGVLTVPGTYVAHTWYKNGVLVGTAPAQTLTGAGNYTALLRETDGCLVKTCTFEAPLGTALNEQTGSAPLSIYPNPVEQGWCYLRGSAGSNITLYDLYGHVQTVGIEGMGDDLVLDLRHLQSGVYLLRVDQGLRRYTTRVTVLAGRD